MTSTVSGPRLRTERLLLEPIGDEHVAALVRHWGDEAVARYLWLERPVSIETVASIARTSNRDFRSKGYGIWALLPPDEEGLVGMCGLRQVEDRPWVEILFSLRQRHWGKGLGTEAVFAVLEYAFETLQLDRVVALVDERNEGLVRLLKRVNMAPFTKDAGNVYWEVVRARFLALSKRPPAPTDIG